MWRTRFLQLSFLSGLTLVGCASYSPRPLTESAVEKSLAEPGEDQLRVMARSIKHPLLKPVEFDDREGLTPDQAAVLAVILNPSLRAARDERGLASSQLLQAGILPNPQLTFGEDFAYGGAFQGAVTANSVGLNWDISQLVSHDAKVRAAEANAASVDLSIAWQEWQIAQAAKAGVYDLISLKAQLALAEQIENGLNENLSAVRKAVQGHQKTVIDLAAAESASQDAHGIVLTSRREVENQRLVLNKALGLMPEARIKLRSDLVLPDDISVPAGEDLSGGLQGRRLDLLALKLGYQSEEETLRSAVLQQFPKINIGFNRQRDNSNVQSLGFAVAVDLPIFDRNQGAIATERATRQRLFDEYTQRVYEARFDVATSLAAVGAIREQIIAGEESVNSLRNLSEVYRQSLDRGNLDVLSYYASQSNLSQKQLDVLKLKQQLMDNRFALELAAGEYLPICEGAAARPATKPTQPSGEMR